MDKVLLSQHMQAAHDAANGMSADDAYKLEAFKIVLTHLLDAERQPAKDSSNASGGSATDDAPQISQEGVPEWQRRIALKLGLNSDQVGQIYHLDNDGALRLILNTSVLPKNSSPATQDIAVLLASGRVAAKFDELGTSSDVIKEEVDYYGRLDKSNFARILGKLKPNFNFSSRDKLLTPRAPGFADAGNIAKKYLAVEQGGN